MGVLGLVVIGAVVAGSVAGALAIHGAGSVTLPESPAQQAGVSESRYIDQTSLSEVPGRLATPVAAVDAAGKPLRDSASIVAALRAKDGRTVTLPAPTIV